ncbi:hypothetical protein OURE66S_04538 [Oligella ureolytica]
MEEETRRLIRDAIAADRIVAVLDYGDPMVYRSPVWICYRIYRVI